MSFKCIKACAICRITEKISHILWIILGNDWKCAFNCVSMFVSIAVNFNALCDVYLV